MQGGSGQATPPDHVLLVEDNDIVARVLERVLGTTCELSHASGVVHANQRLDEVPIDVVLCDFRLLDGDGVMVLRHARERQPRALRLLMSGGLIPGVDELVEEGVVDASLPKPFSRSAFEAVVATVRAARAR